MAQIGKINPGLNAPRKEIIDARHQIHVARALAVPEQRSFHTIGTGHESQLGRGYGHALVVVRMERNGNAVALRKVAAEIFDHIRIVVWRAALDSRREIHDHRLVRRPFAPRLKNRFTELQRKVDVGIGKLLGRKFVAEV